MKYRAPLLGLLLAGMLGVGARGGAEDARPMLAAALHVPAGRAPVALLGLDADADGRADILAAARDDDRVAFLKGVGNGTFRSPVLSSACPAISALAAGDFNGDGRPDAVCIGQSEEAGQARLACARPCRWMASPQALPFPS